MSEEQTRHAWPDCKEVQCRQSHDSLNAIIELLGLKNDDSVYVVGKATRIALEIKAREAEMEALRKQRDNRIRPRFIEMYDVPAEHRKDKREGQRETKWWLDMWRPLSNEEALECEHRFVAVERYADKDPNNFVPVYFFHTLFTDQAEYYFVCGDCRSVYGGMQWSGSTRGVHGWREKAAEELVIHQNTRGWCQFCDPVFGNGGWSLR